MISPEENDVCFRPGNPAARERAHRVARGDILLRGLGLGAALGVGAMLPSLAEAAVPARRPAAGAQVYVEVSALSSLPYFIAHRQGMTLAGRDLNVTTEYLGPSTLDLSAMINVIEQQIVRKVAGLLWTAPHDC